MTDALKPCPFCGGAPYPKRTEDTDWSGSCFVSMACRDCGAETRAVYGSADPTEWAEARAAWNRRAALAAPAVPPDVMRKALKVIDKYSVATIRTNSKDRGDWAEDMAYVGKVAREALAAAPTPQEPTRAEGE